jgi:hypothetical protein
MKLTAAVAVVVVTLLSNVVLADERPYTDGSVWAVSTVRTSDGMFDIYMESLGKTYKPVMDEAKKQGLILSYKIIGTNSSGPDDYNVLFLVEYKNWAAFDGISEKFEAIARKSSTKAEDEQLMKDRVTVRRYIDDKTGQEIILK